MESEQAVSPLKLEDFRLTPATSPLTHSVHTEFDYHGYFKQQSLCGLDIYTGKPHTVCFVTELGENPGTSITNRIGEIAHKLGLELAKDGCQFFNFPKRYVLIEHWPGDKLFPEHFDLVMFMFCRDTNPTDPKYYRLEREQVTRLLGREYEGF